MKIIPIRLPQTATRKTQTASWISFASNERDLTPILEQALTEAATFPFASAKWSTSDNFLAPGRQIDFCYHHPGYDGPLKGQWKHIEHGPLMAFVAAKMDARDQLVQQKPFELIHIDLPQGTYITLYFVDDAVKCALGLQAERGPTTPHPVSTLMRVRAEELRARLLEIDRAHSAN